MKKNLKILANRNKKRKGFTLIELLTVITLLGIILLIIVPNVLGTYNDSKEKTFKINVEKLYDAVEAYSLEYELLHGKVLKNATIEIIDSKIEGDLLSLKGDLPEIGTIVIDDFGEISLVAYDSGICGERIYTDSEVTVVKMEKSECKLYNVRPYELIAKDFSIIKGNNVDLIEHVYLSRYNKKIEEAEITYTSNPEFDYNNVGRYQITYNSLYEGKTYEKTITVSVESTDL